MEDEILDKVDEFDNVIGTINRKDYKDFLASKSGYIRAAELFIMNDEGKLWIPVRTANKTIAPNAYDYAAGGHVESGDDYLETIIRETEEEINLSLKPEQIEFVAKLKSTSIRYFRTVYLHRTNQTPVFNPEDFVSAEWLTPEELTANIDNGHPTKLSIQSTVKVLRSYLSGQ
jgi:8-oxo-dGTP pyrophosphatase MutT (NUDIX family)